MHRRMKEIRSGFPSNFKNKPTMAICDADGKEYWAYSGIHNENSKPYKHNKKKENLKNVALKADKKNKSLKRLYCHPIEGGWDRDVYAKAKLFEFLATQDLSSIYLVVDLDMCDSCKGVLKQFKSLYPNVTVKIVQKKQKR